MGHDPSYVCCRLDYGMVWNNSVTTKPRACVPHTPYTLILRFASPAGRVCGVATHAAGMDAGYGLLRLANNKAEDLSVKKLTRKNPTMKAKFDALKNGGHE